MGNINLFWFICRSRRYKRYKILLILHQELSYAASSLTPFSYLKIEIFREVKILLCIVHWHLYIALCSIYLRSHWKLYSNSGRRSFIFFYIKILCLLELCKSGLIHPLNNYVTRSITTFLVIKRRYCHTSILPNLDSHFSLNTNVNTNDTLMTT